jgi:hypothetical protein
VFWQRTRTTAWTFRVQTSGIQNNVPQAGAAVKLMPGHFHPRDILKTENEKKERGGKIHSFVLSKRTKL